MSPMPPRGLYVLTDPSAGDQRRLLEAVHGAILGGAVMIQYRDKSRDPVRRRQEAEALLACCRGHHVPLIVNDDVALAAAIGPDGVHLGRDDGTIAAARAQLVSDAIVGVSCYNEPERARRAEDAGANYVAFGRFHVSNTKPEAVQATPEMLRKARPAIRVPLVPIGGITPANARGLVDAGADLLAVVGAVIGQPDPRGAARAFAAALDRQTASAAL